MKVQIVRDAKGIIVATCEQATQSEAIVDLELEEGQTTEEIEAPRNYLFNLPEFYKEHRKV